MKKVSVVIPVYNAEEYLYECLKSIKNQTLKDIEVILVDDGSTDDSLKILKEFALMDHRFHLIQQNNLFAGAARNNGIKIAKGEYVLFLDADDIFELNFIENMYENVKLNNSDIVICDAYFFDSQSKKIEESSNFLRVEELSGLETGFSYIDIPERIFQITTPAPWNKLYKKSFIEREGLLFQDIKRSNDEYFVSMSLISAKKITIINKPLVYYRVNNKNSLQGMGKIDEISYDFFLALLAIQNELIHRKLYDMVEKSFINKCVTCCIAVLNKQRKFDNFSKIYNFLKDRVFSELGIEDYNKEFIYSNYDELCKVKEYGPEDYIFNENLKYKKNRGEKYILPYDKLDNCRNIALYGAGKVGRAFWRQLLDSNYYNLAGWFDSQYTKHRIPGQAVSDILNISKTDFDKIIIAIEDQKIAKSVYCYLEKQGVYKNKIVYGFEYN